MDDREAKRAEIAERDLAALRWWQAEAERGAKLGRRTDRLHAALHLAEAWQKAKAKGLNKERFQDMVLEAMRSTHGRTESFKLANYTLPKKFSEVTEDVIRHYKTRSEPSQRLEPYLLAITIAAIHCGADPEQWKMDMLRQTSLWHNSRNNTHALPDDNRGYENLAVLLNSLCAEIARRHELDNAYAAIKAMNCRWEMFQDRLLATDTSCMQWLDSPISPHYANCEYLEEAVPYPSVALLRIPYLVVETGFRLAPEEVLRPLDAAALASGDHLPPGMGITNLSSKTAYGVPAGLPGVSRASGQLTYYREIHLCVVPDGRGGFGAALQSRPRVEVSFPEGDIWAGTHQVNGAIDPALGNGLFYARHADGGHVWPTVTLSSGEVWRLQPEEDTWIPESLALRDPGGAEWEFDADPVAAPGEVVAEPWYLSFTGATPLHLRHWLDGDWALGAVNAVSCFARERFASDRYDTDLPPRREMLFPQGGPSSDLEMSLHNGIMEEALDTSAARLSRQVAELQSTHRSASERHVQTLLKKWHA